MVLHQGISYLLMRGLSRPSRLQQQQQRGSVPWMLAACYRRFSTKLFVGGLSFRTAEEGLRNAFAAHGQVVDVRIITDRETGKSRGFGFVTFESESEADTALSKLNGFCLDGRVIRVDKASARPPLASRPSFDGPPPSSSSFAPSASPFNPAPTSTPEDWGTIPSNAAIVPPPPSNAPGSSPPSSPFGSSASFDAKPFDNSTFGAGAAPTGTANTFESGSFGSSTFTSSTFGAAAAPPVGAGSAFGSSTFGAAAVTPVGAGAASTATAKESSSFGNSSFGSNTFGASAAAPVGAGAASTAPTDTLDSSSSGSSTFSSSTFGAGATTPVGAGAASTATANAFESSSFGSSTFSSSTFGAAAATPVGAGAASTAAANTFQSSSFGSSTFSSSTFGAAAATPVGPGAASTATANTFQSSSFGSMKGAETTGSIASSGTATSTPPPVSPAMNSSTFGAAATAPVQPGSTFSFNPNASGTFGAATSSTQSGSITTPDVANNKPAESTGSATSSATSTTPPPPISPVINSAGGFDFKNFPAFESSSYQDVEPPLPRRRPRPRPRPLANNSSNFNFSFPSSDTKSPFGNNLAETAIPKPKGAEFDFGLSDLASVPPPLEAGARPQGAFDIHIPEGSLQEPPPQPTAKPKPMGLAMFPQRTLPPLDLPWDTPEADNWADIGADPPKWDLSSIYSPLRTFVKKDKELFWDPYDYDEESKLPPETESEDDEDEDFLL